MAFRLVRSESLATGLRRVVREELRSAIQALTDGVAADRVEGIHEARKSIKKIRAVIRLLTPHLGAAGVRDNIALREAARDLAQLRDADVVLTTVDSLLLQFPQGISAEVLSSLRSDLALREQPSVDVVEATPDSAIGVVGNALATLRRTQRLVNLWRFQPVEFEAIEAGLLDAYRKGRRNLTRAVEEPTVENYHELRKRVKDHWYHVRLLEVVRPQVLAAREASLRDLQQCLGDDHDLAILERHLVPESEVLPLIETARAELRGSALALAGRLYQQKPRAFVRRMRELWDGWRSEPLPRRSPISVPPKRARAASQTA